jgi:hypothetical protein
MKAALIIILIFVFVAIFGVAGFGFYNGYRVKTYAKNVNAIMTDSNSKWTIQQFQNEDSADADSLKLLETYANTMRTDCQAESAKLDALKAPGKAKQLQTDADSYFDTCVDVADQSLALTTYAATLTEIGTDMAAVSSLGSSDMNQLAAQLDDMHKKLAESIKKLKAITPPASYKEFNQQFITALEEMDALFVKMSAAAKANQPEQIIALSADFVSSTSKLTGLKAPDSAKMATEMINDDQKNILETMPTKVKTEADSLSKTIFSFSY